MPSRRVLFVAFDGFQSLDLSGPWEVLSGASRRADDGYELLCGSLGGAPVVSSSGLRVSADRAIERVRNLDTLIVVGGTGTRAALADRALITQVGRLAAHSRRVASVCSGAFLLAEAGVLDGRRAVTHWSACDALARRYPSVSVERDPIFVRDGDVITSAGVTAGIDLALSLVDEDLGAALALEVARDLVVYARRPGGQSQFSVQLASQAAEQPPVRELQAWMEEHPGEDLSVAALAGRLHLSERQVSRVFASELGTSPADYVERLRVGAARRLLEEGSLNLDAVASRCGFRSSEVMRRAFQRRIVVSPSEYRSRFRPPVGVRDSNQRQPAASR